MTEISEQLVVPSRFCGPPDSGNGGWTAGALATHLTRECPDNRADEWPTVEVSLRQPPPLDSPMLLTEEDGVTSAVLRRCRDRQRPPGARPSCSTSTRCPTTWRWPPRRRTPVTPSTRSRPASPAAPAATRATGCGSSPGSSAVSAVAATWRPDPSLAEDFHTYVDTPPRASVAATWAALDCVGGWAGDLTDRLMVLGRMTARIDTLPVIGEEHVVVGAKRGAEGRKTFTSATLYDADSRIVATAEHIWIAVDPTAFGGVAPVREDG